MDLVRDFRYVLEGKNVLVPCLVVVISVKRKSRHYAEDRLPQGNHRLLIWSEEAMGIFYTRLIK